MIFSRLSFILLFFLLAPLHLKGANRNNVPFKQNYVPLWGQENMQLLDQSREVQLVLDQHSGKTCIDLYTYANYTYYYYYYKKLK
jgi:hypothetical protein